jgi:hypothetical protein
MRRSEVGLFLTSAVLILVGMASIFIGFFRPGPFCDASCRDSAAGTIEPLPIVVGAIFVLVGVYSLVRAMRRRGIRGPATDEYQGEEGGALQARMARDMRVYYTKGSTRFSDAASAGEFDQQMLSLFDSMEAGAGDIDAKIETLRSYVRNEGLFRRLRDQYRANTVWRKGDESLRWNPQTWQLRTNWARLRILGPTWGSYAMAPAWGAPIGGHASVGSSGAAALPAVTRTPKSPMWWRILGRLVVALVSAAPAFIFYLVYPAAGIGPFWIGIAWFLLWSTWGVFGLLYPRSR